MAIQPRRSQRRRPYATLLILIAITGFLGWSLYPLLQGGEVRLPFGLGSTVAAAEDEPGIEPVPEGRVRVLISGRAIQAYSKVVREDLWNATDGTWATLDVEEEMVEANGILADAKQIHGRVLARPKAAGFPFTEKDFLPQGTRPGMAAGVPAGKRALRVDVDRVHSIIGLQPGDRFDIVAAYKLEPNPKKEQPDFVGFYKHLAQANTPNLSRQRLEVRPLVQNGVVVTPLQTRLVPTTSSSLTAGRTTKTLPVQEMVIAVDPEEVPLLMEAFASDAEVTCLARSGLPDDPVESVTPASGPVAPASFSGPFGSSSVEQLPNEKVRVIEAIHGSRRELVPVPQGDPPR